MGGRLPHGVCIRCCTRAERGGGESDKVIVPSGHGGPEARRSQGFCSEGAGSRTLTVRLQTQRSPLSETEVN